MRIGPAALYTYPHSEARVKVNPNFYIARNLPIWDLMEA